MKVMTFGAVSSPTTAQYIKNCNAKEHGAEHPEAVQAIVDKHCVDDYFDSTLTEDATIQRTAEVTAIHKQGGFQIRDWVSNSETALAHIPSHLRSREVVDLDSSNAPIEKALGLV